MCPHAVVACRKQGLSVYDYISSYYKKDRYAASYVGIRHPIGTESGIRIPDDVKNRVVRKPIENSNPGRPRTTRIPSMGEDPPRQKCSRCGQPGHNRKTCWSAIPVHSTSSQAESRCTRRRNTEDA